MNMMYMDHIKDTVNTQTPTSCKQKRKEEKRRKEKKRTKEDAHTMDPDFPFTQ